MTCDEHKHRMKSLMLNVKTMVERSPIAEMYKTTRYKAPGYQKQKKGKRKRKQIYGKHGMMCDMIYVLRCFHDQMYQYAYEFEWKEHMYTFTVRLHSMFYMEFHARHIDIPMSLNGIEHMYMNTARVHMIYMQECIMQ